MDSLINVTQCEYFKKHLVYVIDYHALLLLKKPLNHCDHREKCSFALLHKAHLPTQF